MLSGRIYQAAVISGGINDHVGSQFAAITQLQAAFLCGFDLDPAAQLDVCPNNGNYSPPFWEILLDTVTAESPTGEG